MLNLYKADLKRIFKDKLFFVAGIIAVAFAFFTPLLNKILFTVLLELDDGLLAGFGANAKTMFFSAFAPGNNLGLIAPILLGIVLCKDFSYGTVRNKIIAGKSRTSIFFSFFLSCATALIILIFLYAFLTLGVSLLLFDYQETPFEMKDFGYLLASLGFEFLVYLFIAALTAFLCVSMKNAGLAVVVYVAVNFLFTIVGSIISTARIFVDPAKEFISKLLQFLDEANIFMGTYIGITPSYDWKGVLPVLAGTLLGTALFVGGGILVFRKKDLK